MISFTDFLALCGMVGLRFGVPLLLVVGLGYLLKRLDRRWEQEAWAEEAKRAARQPARQPGIALPAPRREVPTRTPAPTPSLPYIIPPAVTQRPQPGLAAMPMPAVACWDAKQCSDSKRANCAASQHPEMPCWQARYDAEGQIPADCVGCDIFQQYPRM
jgi:hypothetical protein